MQYLLTQKEMDTYIEARKRAQSIPNEKALQEFCTRVANEMPVIWEGWDDPVPKPWGCILTQKQEWYCDSCPAQDFCPHPHKEWSK